MVWSILTPIGSAALGPRALTFGPPAPAPDAPEATVRGGLAGLLREHLQPGAHQPEAMRQQMPKKYWRNMPEAAAIPALIRCRARAR